MLKPLLQLWPTSLATQALVVGVIVGVAAYQLLKKRYRLPPGPRGWPVFGNMFALREGHIFETFHEWSKIYGPVMKVQLGFTKIILLSRIDVVLEALVKRQSDIAGRNQSFSTTVFSDNGRDIIGGDYGPTWKLHRKIASKALRKYLTGDSLSQKITESLAITTKLLRQEKSAFDPFPYLTLLVYNILDGVCFNKTCYSVDDEGFRVFVDHLDRITELFGGGFLEDNIPIFRLCPTPRFREFKRRIKATQSIIYAELEEHRRTFSDGLTRDFTDAMLEAQREAENEEEPEVVAQMSDIHVRQTLIDVFAAGIDTTRNTLQWTLLALALNPDIQKKIHKEVDEVIGPDLTIDMQYRERLPYTEAVLHEVMRMRPVAPIGVPHTTLVDTSVGGYELPKGTIVMINHYALHFDADQWEDVNVLKPERFLTPSGKMAPKPESWLPFSAGRRVCLGETVAKPELHLLLAGLCRAFVFELAPGTEHDFKTKTKGGANGPGRYKVVVKPRI